MMDKSLHSWGTAKLKARSTAVLVMNVQSAWWFNRIQNKTYCLLFTKITTRTNNYGRHNTMHCNAYLQVITQWKLRLTRLISETQCHIVKMYASNTIAFTHLYTYHLDLWPHNIENLISMSPKSSVCASLVQIPVCVSECIKFTRFPWALLQDLDLAPISLKIFPQYPLI